jgi:predicted GTPase
MASSESLKRTVIMGAAGRDFHNFNLVYRDDPNTRVVAFTAAQIPGIAERRYPTSLAGPRYPDGIPIMAESELEALCREERVDDVVFAYSDVPHATVMHAASRALAAGSDFLLLGPNCTMLTAPVPVIAVSAIRTGCGKSQTTRWLGRLLSRYGLQVAVIRHPMPYGDLARQAVQRFATRDDLDSAHCTIEEREEYEPHLAAGTVIYAGVDYGRIVERAAAEADVILWDGGNNDFPFLRPDLHIVLADALRPGQETSHHPGETVLRMADVVVIAKVNSASAADTQQVADVVARIRPGVPVVRAASVIQLEAPEAVRNRRVLVVEDGPTITHGGMSYGAGFVAATEAGAGEILDPRRFAAPELAAVYSAYPHIGRVLPAVGYGPEQVAALAETIDRSTAEVVVAATPIDLAAVVKVDKPVVRARYDFAETGSPSLTEVVEAFLLGAGLAQTP